LFQAKEKYGVEEIDGLLLSAPRSNFHLKQLNIRGVRFIYEGERIKDNDTPESVSFN
jgi:hypothetical protein